MNQDQCYDGQYEAECYAAAAEAEQEQEYEKFLFGLLEKGKFGVFAAYVAIDWLTSKEFTDSGMSAVDFIKAQKRELENAKDNKCQF